MDFSAFLTSLGTSFVIFLVLMCLFTWLSRRPGNNVIYYPNRILKGLDPYESIRVTRNPFDWIREAFTSTESDVIRMSGVDSAVYFVFLTTGSDCKGLMRYQVYNTYVILTEEGAAQFQSRIEHTNLPKNGRMGRELNCPICLSLLSSSVSLNCNHVFCNSCIEKSMKSASNCPVCKVPYRRREIRPAPHMDNLVSVYRSKEVAMGVNIFVTQTAASIKIPGAAEDNQTGANTCVIQDKGESHSEALDCKNQELRLNKRSKWPATTNQGDFATAFGKPSFPTKKRVQVPSTAEMHRQPGILEERIGEIVKKNP